MRLMAMDNHRARLLQEDLAHMLAIGIPRGYTVDECVQAVHTQSRLESGYYDATWPRDTHADQLFMQRRNRHEDRK